MSCDGNCNYKRLYEGTQASLSDLAAKQAATLKRASKLRSAILSAIKERHPREYAQAEIGLGRQLSGLDDDAVIAYLNAFMALGKLAPQEPVTVESSESERLRAHLASKGINLPDEASMADWESAFAEITISAAPPEDELVSVSGSLLSDLFGEVPDDEYPDSWNGTSDHLADIFAGEEEYPAPSAQDEPVDEDSLAELFGVEEDLFSEDNDSRPTETPVKEVETGETQPVLDSDDIPQETEPAGARTQDSTPAHVPSGQQLGLGGLGPVKPEIMHKPARKRATKRSVRVSADAPSGANLPEELASACAEPVFVNDLAQLSEEERDKLESRLRSGTSDPYTLIPAKAGRARGSLIVPTHCTDSSTPWGVCLASSAIRGQNLYEIATIFANNPTGVRACRPGIHTVELDLADQGNVTLAIYLLSNDLAGQSAVKDELEDKIVKAMGKDYSSVVVLTSARKADAPARLASALAQSGQEQNWHVTLPVFSCPSWRYTSHNSSPLTHILP